MYFFMNFVYLFWFKIVFFQGSKKVLFHNMKFSSLWIYRLDIFFQEEPKDSYWHLELWSMICFLVKLIIFRDAIFGFICWYQDKAFKYICNFQKLIRKTKNVWIFWNVLSFQTAVDSFGRISFDNIILNLLLGNNSKKFQFDF